jgi:hypothetical protein
VFAGGRSHALLGAVALAMSSTMTTTVTLVATTVLYMRGTNIGGFLPDDVYAAYAGQTVNETAGDYDNIEKVEYPRRILSVIQRRPERSDLQPIGGDGPLKKVLGALTAQRSTEKQGSAEADGEAPSRSREGDAA